jgi:hypothetical protein
MLTLLQNITQKLNHLQIPYMLTGSMAMGFYTIPRNTLDLDLVVELNPEDMRALVQSLKNEFYISEDALQTAVAERGMFNVIDHQSGFKVDMILTQKTLYAQTAFQRAKLHQDLGFELCGLSVWKI